MSGKKENGEKENKGGRPSAYDTIIKPRMKEIISWCESGLVDEDVCANLGISHETWYKHKRENTEFSEAVTRAKSKADQRVINALFQRCVGYECEEETKEPALAVAIAAADKDKLGDILEALPDEARKRLVVTKVVRKQIVPDVLAIRFWLMNRQRGKWSDKSEVEHSGSIASTIVIQGLYGQPGDIPPPAGAVIVQPCSGREAVIAAANKGNGNGNGHN